MKTYNLETKDKIGEVVKLAGWVQKRRDHGQLIFIDLRDSTGIIQVIFNEKLYKEAEKLGIEDVVGIEGLVKERPQGMQNDKIATGKVEIEAQTLQVLSKAKLPPFELDKDTKKVDEETRMKYRYLDLRSARMHKNLIMRSKITKFIRDYMIEKKFIEIETPYITKGTPEGAREYVIPARLHPGKFYVLPQSPQQFKQLLMISGVERYFQIARCFRDEDPRGDRQPEHTQLDLEMSFVKQEDIWKIVEELMIKLVEKLYPDKKITAIPFPKLTYIQAKEKYNSDKPDLRNDKNNDDELAFGWIYDFPMFTKDDQGEITAEHHPFVMPNEDDLELLEKDPSKVRAYSYDLVLNGYEIASGSIRIHKKEVQEKIFKLLNLSEEQTREKFGNFLAAFEYGVPPHGGIAPGIDRLAMILQKETSIREVIAFPKTGDGRDLMMGAPSTLSQKQLDELGISIKPEK